MKFTIKTIGCKVNTYESNKIKEELVKNGFSYIDVDEKDSYKDLDYYIINTCSVTAIADKKSRQMIHQAKKYNPSVKVVATGCFAESIKSSERDSDIDILVSNNDKLKISKMLRDNVSNISSDSVEKKISSKVPVRSFIKIQDGCDQYCTYCIIPFLRGNIKSRDDEEIVKEIEEKVKNGTKEVVLTGIHLSSFGLDRKNLSYESNGAIDKARDSLLSLMGEIANSKQYEVDNVNVDNTLLRIRLGSLEPRIISKDFLIALKEGNLGKIFCANFCLSLQSGCDKTLKAMNRHYNVDDFENACILIRKYMPNATITTDIIVGFPGETNDDYEESLSFVKRMRFYNPNVFPYSRRKGTKADTFDKQVTNVVKHERAVKMIKECEIITKEIEREHIITKDDILIEEIVVDDGKKYGLGYTKEYIRAKVLL